MSEARLVFRGNCTNEVFLTCHLRLFRLFSSVANQMSAEESTQCGKWNLMKLFLWNMADFFPIHMESFTSLLGFVICYLC